MKTNRTLLLMFLLPVLLAMALAVLINFFSLHSLRQQDTSSVALQAQDIEALSAAARLSEQMAQIQAGVEYALQGTVAGKVSDARLYQVQSKAVDTLAEMAERVKAVSNAPRLKEAYPQDARLLLEHFEKYRNFVIMSADIAAVEPVAAVDYLAQARDRLNEFSTQANHLTALLAGRTLKRNNEGKHPFDSIYNRVALFGAIGAAAILLLSLFFARRISSWMIAIASGLQALSKPGVTPPELPEIERMHSGGTGAFQNIAGALLQLRNAITLRAKAEKYLRDSEAKAQQVLSELKYQKYALDQHSIVAITNADSKITYANEKFCEISGYTQQQLIGQNPRLLKSGIHTEKFYRDMYQALVRGEIWRGEICNLSKDGEYFWLQTSIIPFMDTKGKPPQYIAMYTDISERKATESKLRKVSLAVEQSSGCVIITNPANEIEYVNEAFVNASGYSREEAMGRNPSFLYSPKTPQQTFLLLEDAMNKGESWKDEFIHRRKDGSEYLQFSIITPIRQTGGTITYYVVVNEDITEKTRKSEEMTRHRQQLEKQVESLTAQLAEARAAAEAANQAKDAFLANINHEIRAPMATSSTDIEYVKAELRQLAQGAHILLVDGDNINLAVAKDILRQVGLTVDTAVNGLQAVEMSRNMDYHLIIMAVKMPEMDGLEAARIIHGMAGRTTTPILAMTTDVFDEDMPACLQAGISDFVAKPVEPDALYTVILKWLSAA